MIKRTILMNKRFLPEEDVQLKPGFGSVEVRCGAETRETRHP